MTPAAQMIAVLLEARAHLAREDNDFAWSSWEDASAALAEIDALIAQLNRGERPSRALLEVLFLPTGPIQEVSLSSGWSQAFVELASRFDDALEALHPSPH